MNSVTVGCNYRKATPPSTPYMNMQVLNIDININMQVLNLHTDIFLCTPISNTKPLHYKGQCPFIEEEWKEKEKLLAGQGDRCPALEGDLVLGGDDQDHQLHHLPRGKPTCLEFPELDAQQLLRHCN